MHRELLKSTVQRADTAFVRTQRFSPANIIDETSVIIKISQQGYNLVLAKGQIMTE